MAEPKTDRGAVYETLRRELIHLLRERRSQGHFTWLTDGTNHARGRFFADLTHSIADILATAYPKKDPNAYAAAIADAETIVSSVLDRGHLSSRPTLTGSQPASTSTAPLTQSANDNQATTTKAVQPA
jgi:hypothetical protein